MRLLAAAPRAPSMGRAALCALRHTLPRPRGSRSTWPLCAAVHGGAPRALYGPGGAVHAALHITSATRLTERVATTCGGSRRRLPRPLWAGRRGARFATLYLGRAAHGARGHYVRLYAAAPPISGRARQRALRPLRAGRRLVRGTTLSLSNAAHGARCCYQRPCAVARPAPVTGRAALGAGHHAVTRQRGSRIALLLSATGRGGAPCALYGPGDACPQRIWQCSAPCRSLEGQCVAAADGAAHPPYPAC